MTHPNDPIIDGLCSQAREYDPEPPAHLNRRIRSAVAEATDMPGGAKAAAARAHGVWWPIAATSVVGAVLAGAMIVQHARPWSREIAKIPQEQQPRKVVTAGTPHTMIASANPLVLTQQWIETPIRTEMDGLLSDLTRTRDTVVRVLPAASKRAKPADAAPAPDGA